MKIKDIIRKLTSRKFLLALAAVVSGIITAFIGNGETVRTIVGAAVTIIATVAYCIMEGVVDAASVKTVTDAAKDIAEEVGASEDVVDCIEQLGVAGEAIITPEKAPVKVE